MFIVHNLYLITKVRKYQLFTNKSQLFLPILLHFNINGRFFINKAIGIH